MSDERAHNNDDHQPPEEAQTFGTWTGFDGSTLDYTAAASWMVLRKKEKPSAEVFSVSYIVSDDAHRPVTFAFITHGRHDLVTPYHASDRLRNLCMGVQPHRVPRCDRIVRRRGPVRSTSGRTMTTTVRERSQRPIRGTHF